MPGKNPSYVPFTPNVVDTHQCPRNHGEMGSHIDYLHVHDNGKKGANSFDENLQYYIRVPF